MGLIDRFLVGFRSEDRGAGEPPGLVQNEDGTIDYVQPDGTRTGIGTGGESSVLPSEPTDGSLVAGDCKLWFSDTAGAPTLHVKSKDANGAVFTATIPLTAA